MTAWFFIILAIALSPLLLMWILTRRAPIGFEDASGFHEGIDRPVQSLPVELCQCCGAPLPIGWVCYCSTCLTDDSLPTALNAVGETEPKRSRSTLP